MKITTTEAKALRLLVDASGSEMYGLEMVRVSGGSLKRGSIYVILGRLEDKGFVESRKEEPDPSLTPAAPRRLYRTTEAGQRIYRAYSAFQMETSSVGEAAPF